MDLRRKVLLGFFFIIIAIMVVLATLPVLVILGNYQTLESTYVRSDVSLVEKNLKAEIRSLEANAPDWGAWDDTYAFVKGEKPDFVEVNLVAATFETLRAGFIIITDEEGTILYANGYDLASGTAEPVSPSLIAELETGEILSRTLDGMNGVSGFLSLPEGPVIFGSYPILRSDYSGPPEGMVIIGRNVADTEILRQNDGDGPAISVTSFDPSTVKPADLALLTGSGGGAVLVRPINEQLVEGQTVIRDIYGRDTLVLTIGTSRGIYQQGKETILTFILLQLAIILMVGIFGIVALDRGVFARINAINDDITAITGNTGEISRIRVAGSDELSRLAGAMNALLDQIGKNQAELFESEEKFRSLVETSPDLIWELDREGKFLYLSPSVISILGYTPEETIGRRITDLVPEEQRDPALQKLSDLVTSATGQVALEVPVLHRNGRIVVLEIRTARMSGPAGTLKGFRGVAIDITERKLAENTLRQVIKKLNILSSITRHDILNQLSILRGYLTQVKKNVTDPKLQTYVAKQESAAGAIEHQISFTRDYENIGVHAPQWQDVKTTIGGALAPLQPLPFAVTVDIEGLHISADPLLAKVFYNLVENSIRHGGNVTRITFSCQESADGLLIVYEDDGKGVPLPEKENIFNRKYFSHTGLGLFLSREILGMTGISIRECGEEGRGARFEIVVPKAAVRFN